MLPLPELRTISGPQPIRAAVYSTGSSQTHLTHKPFFLRRSTKGPRRSPTFHTMLRMVRGSFLATVCSTALAPCCLAFTTQSTTTPALLNWRTCLWAGMPNAVSSENRGFERSTPRKTRPSNELVVVPGELLVGWRNIPIALFDPDRCQLLSAAEFK